MLTQDQAAQLRTLITAVIEAEVAESWKGGGDPADIPAIEYELLIAKHNLNVFIVDNTVAV